MASLRKKYSSHIESNTDAPVTSPLAAEPSPAAEPRPIEPVETKSPADAAASSAIQQRLDEMNRAEQLARQQPQQTQRAAEPPQQQPEMPAAVAKWLAEHPEYTNPNDQIAQVEISLATMKAARDGLTWNDDDFLPSIERHLGLSNGHAERHRDVGTMVPASKPPPSAPPRPTVERPPPQRMSIPVSAPPTREAPSMRTGRPVSYRAPLKIGRAHV